MLQDELIIQKPKIQEFEQIMSNPQAKLLLFTGPAGSGKNSLIDVYCKSHSIEVLRYKDEHESKFYDIEFDNGFMKDYSYPEDLENLIYFIKT